MKMEISSEEINQYIDRVPEFIAKAEYSISGSITSFEEEVKEKSIAALDEGFKEAKRLMLAILNFIQRCKSGVAGNSSDAIGEKLALIVNYYQSVHHTESLLLRGQYIATAALMKKDFETMVRLKEVSLGKAKYGKTPNANHAPPALRFIYGQLNDVAHISKDHVVGFYLEVLNAESEKGVSASPQFKEEQFKAFYAYHLSIMQTIVVEAVALYKEMYGIDQNYKDMSIYTFIVNNLIEQIGEEYLDSQKTKA
jgi:hypothetical protein